jgi:hypothetical protein
MVKLKNGSSSIFAKKTAATWNWIGKCCALECSDNRNTLKHFCMVIATAKKIIGGMYTGA